MDLDDATHENISSEIRTICKTAIIALDTFEENSEDIVEKLEHTAEAIQQKFGLGEEVMVGYRAAISMSKMLKQNFTESSVYKEAKKAQEMIYALCERLDDPKEIMYHVRTADALLDVWIQHLANI